MANYEKKIYYVTKEQYDILYANGSITVGGVTYTGIDPNSSYFVRPVPDFYELMWDNNEDKIQLLKNGDPSGDPMTVGFAQFAGNSGHASQADSSGTSLISIDSWSNTDKYLTFVDNNNSSSYQSLKINPGIKYNPANNALTATTFIGALTGTATGNLTSNSSLPAGKLTGAIPTTVTQTNWDAAHTHSTTNTGSVHGSTTVGGNLLRLTNPNAVRFLRVNANNTVSSLTAAEFRSAIGAGTSSTSGTVTSVGGTGTVSGITLTGTVTSSGNLTLGGAISGLTTTNLSASAGIKNTQLANSSVTIGSTSVSLGSTATSIVGLTSLSSTNITAGLGTQTWQIADSSNNLLFQYGSTPATKATLYTDGALTLTGKLTATSKSFLIDHPTKQGYKLEYGSLEGPENGVYVRGKLAGSNIIELPDYWAKLIDTESITVTLTPIENFQKLYVEKIDENKVYIKNASKLQQNRNINCFYTVYAERIDVDKIKVERKVK